MDSSRKGDTLYLALDKQEALVLLELLGRWVEEQEARLLPLLESSAEFALLCRLNSHLENQLPEALAEDYEESLRQARKAIIRLTGHYAGIEER